MKNVLDLRGRFPKLRNVLDLRGVVSEFNVKKIMATIARQIQMHYE